MFTIKIISPVSTSIFEWPNFVCVQPHQDDWIVELAEMVLNLKAEGYMPEIKEGSIEDMLPYSPPAAVISGGGSKVHIQTNEDLFVTNNSGKTVFSLRAE